MFKKLQSIIVVVVLLSSLFSFAGMQEVQAAGNTYYVATTGNDTTGDGSIGNPWETIQKAANTMEAGDTCIIRGGTYRETVTPANSGTSGSPIKFQAYPGETVTVSGADLVTGWTQHSGSIYKATKTLSLGDQNQIFVDGQMMNEARWPNTGLDLLNPTLATADSGTQTSITDDALIPLGIDWTGANVWSSIGHKWTAQTGAVTGYNASTGTINFNAFGVTGGYNGFLNPKAGSPYYLYGKLEALDIATEWFYNNSITTLYLWAPNGGDLSNHTVEAKARTYAFDLSNRNYIEISGVKIFASTITMANATYSKLTSIEAKYVSHFASLTKYTEHYYDSGIIVSGNNNEIRNSTIAYSAGNGITIFDGSNNRVINSLIRDVDYSGTNDSGIVLAGKDHAVSNSTIYNCGRAAVMPGGMKGGLIQYNDLYNAGMLTDDVGVIYEWQGDGQNAEIHHNFIHDNKALDYPAGIYLDNGSSNWILHHNVIWNTKWNGIMLNSPNKATLLYNNTLYNASSIAGYAPDDLYGTQVFNNIMTDPIPTVNDVFTSNPNVAMGFNLNPGSDPQFVDAANNNFRLQSSSPAINEGTVVPGITDGYVGSAPDIGAYEYGGADWTAGHNFETPPNPTFITVDTPYMNRVKNAGFELTGDMATMLVDAYFETSEPVVDFKFYTSGDGINYNEITPVKTDLEGNWKNIRYESSLYNGTKFLKIEYGNVATDWTPQISRVQIGYARGDIVVDNMEDFTKMYSYTSNLTFETTDSSYFNGDASRLCRTTTDYENIVYSTKNLSLDSWTKTNSYTATAIYDLPPVSRTGASYVQLGNAEDGIEQVISGLSPNTEYTLSGWAKISGWAKDEEVRIGVKDYGGSDKYAAITSTDWSRGTVAFKTGESNSSAKIYLYKPPVTIDSTNADAGIIIDELDDFSKVYSRTSSLYFDSGNPVYFNGDTSRVIRSSATNENIIYRTPGNMTTFLVDAYFESSLPIVDFKFYTSTDGATYNEFIPDRTDLGGYWTCIRYESSSLPSDTKYLKVEFGGTSGPAWSPNLSRVEIGYIPGDNPLMYSFVYGDDFAVIKNMDIIPVTEITLAQTEASIYIDEAITLTATVLPTNATNKEVMWGSSNPAAAVVDGKGIVTGVGAGTTTITVTTADGNYAADCKVTVSEPVGTLVDELDDFTKIYSHTNSLYFDTSNAVYFNGDTSRVIRSTATKDNIIYRTPGNMTTLLVDAYFESSLPIADFKFYTSSDGVTYNEFISDRTDLGGYWTCIRYESSSLPSDIKYLKIEFGGTSGPSWSPNLSRVEIGYGNAIPTVPVTGITLDKTEASVYIDETTTLTATVLPTNATNKEVEWSSSNPAAAVVDSNGVVTGVGVGTTTITVTTVDGNYAADCEVTVSEPVGTLIDELDDFTKMYSRTSSMHFDTSNPVYFNGDTSRVIRSTATNQSIIYRTPGNMTTFLVDAYFESSLPIVDFKFYTSTDGVTYNEFIPDRTDLGGYWTCIRYESSSLPSDIKYLKIEFGGTSAPTWTPNLSRVEIGYGSTTETGITLDKTPPAFNLIVNGDVLKEGNSFDDYLPLTFKVWDNLSGVASAKITIDGTDYIVNPQTQSSIDIDLAGKVGSLTATVTAQDIAGNTFENAFQFTITTSIGSVRHLIDRYVKDGKLGGPMSRQLTNNLDQVQHQLDIGRPDQAVKHMGDFIKHLNNKALGNNIKDNVKMILNADAVALIKIWSGK